MSEHRLQTIHFSRPFSLATTAVLLLFLSLPWSTGCDASPTAAQLAGLTNGTAVVATDSLAKLSLSDVSNSVNELQQPDALAGSQLPPPPPCAEEIKELTRQCIEDTRTMATLCIDQIGQLFAEMQIDAAHNRAGQCIEEINLHAEGCLQGLRDQCETCLDELLNQDAPPEVIRALMLACRRAARYVFRARRTAVGAIEDAVDRGVMEHCIETIHKIAVGCAEQNGKTATDCIARIEGLPANEQVAVAHDCIKQIHAQSAECARALQKLCHNCLQRLIHNGGIPELVRRVRDACKDNIRLILVSVREAVGQIHDSLPPPPDTKP